MKRSGFTRAREPMKRTGNLRRTGRLRAKRQKPGVTGRPSADRMAWAALKYALWDRARGHCEVPLCWRPASDPHHIVKRSAGGPDCLKNLAALCRRHHDQTDAPYVRGRLVVRMVDGPRGWRPRFEIQTQNPKRAGATV